MTSQEEAMSGNIMQHIAEYYHSRHKLVLKLVDSLNDQQIMWRANRTTPSIAFHVWHLARWADYLQEMLTGLGVQIWEQEALARKWGFDNVNLGFAETGLGMDDDVMVSLPFPRKEVLLDYARRAFIRADQAINTIDDDQFQLRAEDRHGVGGNEIEIGDAVLNWLVHDSRHLGMIECLLGVQGFHGSATR
jgi:hypothetical protein